MKVGAGGWEKQRTRAVASLEMRKRGVASFEDSRGSTLLYVQVAPGPMDDHDRELWPPEEDATG